MLPQNLIGRKFPSASKPVEETKSKGLQEELERLQKDNMELNDRLGKVASRLEEANAKVKEYIDALKQADQSDSSLVELTQLMKAQDEARNKINEWRAKNEETLRAVQAVLKSNDEDKEKKLQILMENLRNENDILKDRLSNSSSLVDCVSVAFNLDIKIQQVKSHEFSVKELDSQHEKILSSGNVEKINKWKEETRKEMDQLDKLHGEIGELKLRLMIMNHSHSPIVNDCTKAEHALDGLIDKMIGMFSSV